ncbi:hypothetical protein vseg_007718 [Gypsophila vaccaria]
MSPIIITWFILCATTLIQVKSYPENELIKFLPGQPTVNFKQFGGYVTVDGETQQQQINFFYYFVEAEFNPESKPLVLWLNGGPGCSSVGYGAFMENGPFRPTENALLKNEYSWNKEANMLYLDSPSKVGFSYSSNTSFNDVINDNITARNNLAFLRNWLTKFPEYKNRDLFLTGESYAGHYIPQLANLILNSTLKSNLKGIALGSPLLELNKDFNSRGEYLWTHGVISDGSKEMLQKVCNFSEIERQNTRGAFSQQCTMVRRHISVEFGTLLNMYDVTLDVCLHQQRSHLLSLKEEKVDVCLNDKTTKYLNRKDVQQALHAQLVGITQWSPCTTDDVLKYHMEDLEIPTLPLLGTMIKQGVRVLTYSGDQDAVIPLMSTRALMNELATELELNTTVPYKSWIHDNQVGGWTQVYGDILTFATVRGAAHEAPYTNPAQSLELFRSFLQGKRLPTME